MRHSENWSELRKINKALIARYSRSNPDEFGSTSQPFYDYADQVRLLLKFMNFDSFFRNLMVRNLDL